MPSATPILDLELPLPARRSRSRHILIGAAVGVLLGIFAARLVPSVSTGVLQDLVLWFVAFLATLVIHEVGHLLAGSMVGFRFNAISVGLLWFGYEYGKLRLRIRRIASISGSASVTLDRLRRVRRRYLVFVAGGVIANIVTGLAAAVLLANFGIGNDFVHALMSLYGFISLFIGVVNIIPFRTGAFWTDGGRILALLTSRGRARSVIANLALGMQRRQGIAGADLKATWLCAAAAAVDGSIDELSGCLQAYAHYNDREDEALAAQYLERCLRLANQPGRTAHDTIALEAAVFAAWFRRDADKARRWLVQVKSLRELPKLMQKRAEIAIACADFEFDKALGVLDESAAMIGALPATPVRDRLQKGFQKWRGQIEERKKSRVQPDSLASSAMRP